MLFLLNNLWTLIVILPIVAFIVYMIIKIVREIKMNRLLESKHKSMRIPVAHTGMSKRIGILTSTAFAPVFVILILVIVGITASPTTPGTLEGITSSKDILSIYDDFSDKATTYDVIPNLGSVNQDVVTTGALDDYMIAENYSDSVVTTVGTTITYSSIQYSSTEGVSSPDYSDTNVQVQGIDEMDNVVTDGKYIYIANNNHVDIALAYTSSDGPNALSNYRSFTYDQTVGDYRTYMAVSGLYVDDQYLIVVGSKYTCSTAASNPICTTSFLTQSSGYFDNVQVKVYDKANDFSLVSQYQLSGNLLGSRKIDHNLMIITSRKLYFATEDFNIEDNLPYYSIDGVKTITPYTDINYIDGVNPNSFTSFFNLDLDNKAVDDVSVLGDSGYDLYVTTDNIYILGNIYSFEAMADYFDLEEPVASTNTAIIRIAIDGSNLSFAASGIVPGYTLSQFSMDEQNGYLRIATTTEWWKEVNNRLIILDENLQEVSRLEHIGKTGEAMKSVRFIGDYAYIVTFHTTDPLYVLNLSDPTNPKTDGTLELPGYSTYLEPLGTNYLLGIGRSDGSGVTSGVKIVVYDITDKTDPRVLDDVIFDYQDFGFTFTSVAYEHKDLLVDLNKGIIALPFQTNIYTDDGYVYNSGILVYNFSTTNGLTYKGFIKHEDDSTTNVYVYKIKFISNYFYSISNKYIKVSPISDPENIINSLTLPTY